MRNYTKSTMLSLSSLLESRNCLLHWWRHLLVESESSQKSNKLRLDALSIPHYVVKKARPHGARHGKTEALKQYHIAFNAWKRCRKRVDGQEEHCEGIQDRFLRDQVYRDSQLNPLRQFSTWTGGWASVCVCVFSQHW